MKTKQKGKGIVYILLGIFMVATTIGFVRFAYIDSAIKVRFLSLPLTYQQKIVQIISVYSSPDAARWFIHRMNLPKERMHDIVPVLGQSAYRVMGDNGFGVCGGDMTVRCYHGVMTGIIQRYGLSPEILYGATMSCLENSVNDNNTEECGQAAGYTILWLHTYWYIESLQYCDRVFSEQSQQYNCWIGVSHENVQRLGDSLRGLYEVPWTSADIYYPCDAIPLVYQPACVKEQVKAIAVRELGYDRQRMIDYCMYFTHVATQKNCLPEVASIIAVTSSQGMDCDAFPVVYRDQCVLDFDHKASGN